MQILYTMGYGCWPTNQRMAKMLDALELHGVRTLIDIRHSPCASDPTRMTNYGAKDWNLQETGGIEERLKVRGIEYHWIVELGNPQKRDRQMKVLRAHLESGDTRWPVVRGLTMLATMIRSNAPTFCLLCACREYEKCHRQLVAEALNSNHFGNRFRIVDLSRTGRSSHGQS